MINNEGNESKERFVKAEQKSRTEAEAVLRKMGAQYWEEQDLYSPYDIEIKYNGKPVMVEQKSRGAKYKDYMIREEKLNRLVAAKNEKSNDTEIWYMNTFSNGDFLVWNLTDDLINESRKDVLTFPQYTMSDSPRIPQSVIFLDPSKAIYKDYNGVSNITTDILAENYYRSNGNIINNLS